MKIMFYMPEAIMSPAHEIFLDLIEQHLIAGDECIAINCSGNLPVCHINQKVEFSTCHLCKNRMKRGLQWLSGKVTVELLGGLSREQKRAIRDVVKMPFKNTEEVKEFHFEGDDVGSAAVSSVISYLREPAPDYRQHEQFILKHLELSMIVHCSVSNLLKNHKPDRLVVFNGRISLFRPALRVGVLSNIKTLVLDTIFSDKNRYLLTEDTYLHNVKKYGSYIESVYNESDLSVEEKQRIGLSFFSTQRHNPYSIGNNVKLSDIGLGEDGCAVVSIFNSSEDEFVCIPELQLPYYNDQADGLIQIIEDLLAIGSIRVVLRVHPNLRGVDNTQTRSITRISNMFGNRLVLFDAESNIDSYDLIQNSDMVVTFGSTVGLEAVFAGVTSILMGHAFYESLKCVAKPSSHDEFIQFVKDFKRESSPSKEKRDAELQELGKYGFFFLNFGYASKFRNYRDGKNFLVRDGVFTHLDNLPLMHKLFRKVKAFFPSADEHILHK